MRHSLHALKALPPAHTTAEPACTCNYMQGINRLGKAAPRPGSMRPVDPTRNRTTDHFSETPNDSMESDRDYQRAVQDVSSAKESCSL